MKISKAGIDLIREFEGYHEELPDGRCRAYLDTLASPPIWTIGWGCTEGVKKGMIWSREEAEAALMRELSRFEAAVTRLVTVELNQNQFDALVSFAYNCGEGALAKSTLLKKLNKGNYQGAANELDRWVYAGGKKYTGLVRRRAAEKALFLKPVEKPDEPEAPKVAEQGANIQATAAAGGAAAGGGASLAIPSPPEAVTETVGVLTSWQGLIATGQAILLFAREQWIAVAITIGVIAGLTLWSRRRA